MGIFKEFLDAIWPNTPTPNRTEPSIIEKIKHSFETGNNPGEYGEWTTEYALNAMQSEYEYYTMKNVYIPYKNRTVEIDLIMLHEKGIYVFESKNYGGWIYGNENSTYWTQTLKSRAGIQKVKFYNPIMQNKTHIKALEEYVGFPERIKPVSVIVFGNRCLLKEVPKSRENLIICYKAHLLKKLEENFAQSKISISSTKLAEYNRILEKCNEVSIADKKRHIDQVNEYKKSRG